MSAVIQLKETVLLVPTEYVPMEWPRIYDLLKPAVDRSNGRWNMQAVLSILCTGGQQLWLVLENEIPVGAMTTQIVEYPRKRLLAIHFLGGKGFDEWGDEILSAAERYAADAGCQGIEIGARFGFWPFLKRRGYRKAYCIYERDFSEDK